MTHQEQLSAVRQKIIEANPSILELGFGCEVTPKQIEENFTGEVYENRICMGNEWFVKKGFENIRLSDSTILYSFEILGRKITLADVLLLSRACGKKLVPWCVDECGFFYAKDIMNQCILLGGLDVRWNLIQDDLNLQSEECIDFLYSLLCK